MLAGWVGWSSALSQLSAAAAVCICPCVFLFAIDLLMTDARTHRQSPRASDRIHTFSNAASESRSPIDMASGYRPFF